MAIVLSRDDKIVLFINSLSRVEFRKRFLRVIAKRKEFTAALDEERPSTKDLDLLRNMFIAAGVPRELVITYGQVREAAQAVMNRIMESLKI